MNYELLNISLGKNKYEFVWVGLLNIDKYSGAPFSQKGWEPLLQYGPIVHTYSL